MVWARRGCPEGLGQTEMGESGKEGPEKDLGRSTPRAAPFVLPCSSLCLRGDGSIRVRAGFARLGQSAQKGHELLAGDGFLAVEELRHAV